MIMTLCFLAAMTASTLAQDVQPTAAQALQREANTSVICLRSHGPLPVESRLVPDYPSFHLAICAFRVG